MYEALPTKENKADVAKMVYMYLFGGMYVDPDTECVKPFDHSFVSRGVSMDDDGSLNTSIPAAFFGHMNFDNTDATLPHTILNAWMVVTTGHTIFFLFS
jgi:mannosyltransferase OCH1-like enzyme